jgi:hypothetical protein
VTIVFLKETHTMISKRIALVTLFVPLLLASLPAAQTTDDAAVREALNQYFRGHATAAADEMRKAFLPTGHVEGIREGKFVSWTVEEYASRFPGKPAADEASRKRTIDFDPVRSLSPPRGAMT